MTQQLTELLAQIDHQFHSHTTGVNAPGLVYGIVHRDKLLACRGIGVRHVESGAAVAEDTVFRIASMTKSFAAVAILQLRDSGRLRLDDSAEIYVPEIANFILPTSDAPSITIRHLLTMSAGFPQDDPWADRQTYRSDASINEIFQLGATSSTSPDTGFEYSNYGYMLLGRIITTCSGQPALDYITEHILQPLGMHDSVWNPADVDPSRLAHGYQWLDDAWLPQPILPSGGDNSVFAGLFTTVADLALWTTFFLSAWPARDGADDGILKRSSLREMQQIHSIYRQEAAGLDTGIQAAHKTAGYGYGLGIIDNGRWFKIGHSGGLPGFGSNMVWSPTYDISVISMGNVTNVSVSDPNHKALDLLAASGHFTAAQPQPSRALLAFRREIIHLLQEWDDEIADAIFADNFFLDLDKAHWQQRLEALQQSHGELKAEGEISAENALRGTWRMRGDRGYCDIFISLMPVVPPLVQKLKINSVFPEP